MNHKLFFKTFALVVALSCALSADAYTFVKNGIYYNKLTNNTVEVTYKDNNYNSYSGQVNIPATVVYNGTTYQVTAIGENAFKSSINLTGVYVGDNVTDIGKKAFYFCQTLSTVTLGTSMKTISSGVFAGCDNLETVECFAVRPPTLSTGAFSNTHYSEVKLYVPAMSVNDYKTAENWKNFSHINTHATVEVFEGFDFFSLGPNSADVNGDNEVNIADVNAVISSILGGPTSAGTNSGVPSNNLFAIDISGVTYTMVPVQGGTFWMGETGDQLGYYTCAGAPSIESRKPVHRVTLSNYFIGMTEVTQELWLSVMGNSPSYYSSANGFDNNMERPVEQVSWYDCQVFIERLNEMTGLNFRLPTEAEWEYAARGGIISKHYWFSGSSNLEDVAWAYGNYSPIMAVFDDDGIFTGYVEDPSQVSGNIQLLKDRTQPIARLQPNELFLFDMTGNVAEWCQDWYGNYSSDNQINPKGPQTGTKRVVRDKTFRTDGGPYPTSIKEYAVSCRDSELPTYKSHKGSDGSTRSIGFRLAM